MDFENDAPDPKKAPKGLVDIIEADVGSNDGTIIASLRTHERVITRAKKNSETKLAAWEKAHKYSEIERKYNSEIKKQEKKETSKSERKQLAGEKRDLDTHVDVAKKAAAQYAELRAQRAIHLKQLANAKGAYFAERSAQATLISEKSAGRLKLIVQQGDNKATYVQMLKKLKIGSHAEKKEIEDIANLISPFDLVEMVQDRDTKKLAMLANLTDQKAESIINELIDPQNLLGTLALQHECYPEDRVDIAYQKKDAPILSAVGTVDGPESRRPRHDRTRRWEYAGHYRPAGGCARRAVYLARYLFQVEN